MTLLKAKLQMDEVIAKRDSPRDFYPFRGLVQRRNHRWLRKVPSGVFAIRQRVFLHFPICALHFKPC